MNTTTNPVYLGKLPTSNPGEFLLETPDHLGRIVRTVVRSAAEVRAHLSAGTSVWSARYGGWIKTDAPLPPPSHRTAHAAHSERSERSLHGGANAATRPKRPARLH